MTEKLEQYECRTVKLDDSTFRVIPVRSAEEIGPVEAMKMLGIRDGGYNTFAEVIESPLGRKFIKWRWLNAVGGKRLINRESLLDYKTAGSSSEYLTFGTIDGKKLA